MEAATSAVAKYSAFLWEGRVPLARLQRALMQERSQLAASPSWSSARGLMAATWLRLLRNGWDMANAHTILDDEGHAVPMLQYSPHDVKLLARRGVERWQGRRIATPLDGEVSPCSVVAII